MKRKIPICPLCKGRDILVKDITKRELYCKDCGIIFSDSLKDYLNPIYKDL